MLQSRTVLIVDDVPEIRHALKEIFESAGFTVCGMAANGKEAIQKSTQLRPDLIVSDLSMPVMSGMEAAPELRRLLPKTPIILYTEYAGCISRMDALASGVTAVVAKSEIDLLLSEAQFHLNTNVNAIAIKC